MHIGQEVGEHWNAILDENYEFNGRERLIEALEKVTPELVRAKFE